MKASRHFVGIDLHKEIIQVCVLDASGEIVEETRFGGGPLADGLKVVEYSNFSDLPVRAIDEVRTKPFGQRVRSCCGSADNPRVVVEW